MKIGKITLCFFAVWVFALSAHARSYALENLDAHPKLRSTARTLNLTDDWPNSEDSVIRHCLGELRKQDAKHPSRQLHQRVQFLDNCCARWTTVGSLKDEYSF